MAPTLSGTNRPPSILLIISSPSRHRLSFGTPYDCSMGIFPPTSYGLTTLQASSRFIVLFSLHHRLEYQTRSCNRPSWCCAEKNEPYQALLQMFFILF
ncbi:hypothetical protein V6N13_090056 [Hibiscus sabdariffa]|uniref:Uncharacterized protein n=1 Tax=Hibiscus sabdariffa TaxID=183260 RepID=A0ABR2QHY9_9ROSI